MVLGRVSSPSLLKFRVSPFFEVGRYFSVSGSPSLVQYFSSYGATWNRTFSTTKDAGGPGNYQATFGVCLRKGVARIFFSVCFSYRRVRLLIFVPFPSAVLVDTAVAGRVDAVAAARGPTIPWFPTTISSTVTARAILIFPEVFPTDVRITPCSPVTHTGTDAIPSTVPNPTTNVAAHRGVQLSLVPEI